MIKNKYGAASLCLWALVMSCSSDKGGEESVTTQEVSMVVTLNEQQFNTAKITVGKPMLIRMGESLSVNGVLDVPPQSHISISAPLGGFVKYTDALEGKSVKKGEVLVTLEHPDYIQLQQDYLESVSQLKFLEGDYNRQVELAKENINASKTLQRSFSDFQIAKARTEGLRLKLELVNISPDEVSHGKITDLVSVVAPISGYITRVNVNAGKYVGPTDVMLVLVDTKHLHAEAMVYERDIIKVKKDQQMEFLLVDQTAKRKSSVFLVGKEVDEQRLVRVHCHLEGKSDDLLPGMYFTGSISLGDSLRSAVPEASIVQFENGQFLFRVLDEIKMSYELVPVTVKMTKNGFSEILFSDLINENTLIVTQGAYDLLGLLKNMEDED